MKNYLLLLFFIAAFGNLQAQRVSGSTVIAGKSLTIGTNTVTGISTTLGTTNVKLPTEKAAKDYADRKVDTLIRSGNNIIAKKGAQSISVSVVPTAADLLNGLGTKATTNTTVKTSGIADNVLTMSNGSIFSVPKNAINAVDVVANNALIAGAKDSYDYYILNAGAGINTIFVSSDWVANNDRRIKVVNYTGNAVTINFQNSKLAPDVSNLNTTQSSFLTNFSLASGKTVELIAVNGQANTSVRWIASGVTDNKIPSSSGGGAIIPGGTTGYVLKKNSSADGDVSWQPDIAGTGGVQAETDPGVPTYIKTLPQSKLTEWDNKVDQVSGKSLSTYDFNDTYKSAIDGLGASLSAKLNANAAITPSSGTKLTVDSKGLVTAVTTATADDIAPSATRLYLTPSYKTILDNTAGVNTGNDKTAVTGLIKGSAGNQVAAIAGTDYATPANVDTKVAAAVDALPEVSFTNTGTGIPLITQPSANVFNLKRVNLNAAHFNVDTTNGSVNVSLASTTGTGGTSVNPTFTSAGDQDLMTVDANNVIGGTAVRVNMPFPTTVNNGEAFGIYKLESDTKPVLGIYGDAISWGAGTATGEDTWLQRMGGSTVRFSSNKSTGAAKVLSTGLIAAGRSTAPTTTSVLWAEGDATITGNLNVTGAVIASNTDQYDIRYIQPFVHTARAMGATYAGMTLGLDPVIASGVNTMAAGELKIQAVPIDSSRTLSSVSFVPRSSASYVSNGENRIGLYSLSGGTFTLIASTADDANLWVGTSGTLKTVNFTTPALVSPGIYYVGSLFNASTITTAPQLVGMTSATPSGQVNTGFVGTRPFSRLQTQTTLATSITFASTSAINTANLFILNGN